MARMNAAEREAALKREEAARKTERKERAPTVGGSIKEGARAVMSALMPRGSTAAVSQYSGAGDAARKREIERQSGD